MADIHIGKIQKTQTGKGKAQLFYHIPIDTPVSGIVPTPESAIAAQLQQAELDALAAGSLIEISRTIVVLANHIGAQVIAEGIQSEEEAQVLRALKVVYGQGYHRHEPDAGPEEP